MKGITTKPFKGIKVPPPTFRPEATQVAAQCVQSAQLTDPFPPHTVQEVADAVEALTAKDEVEFIPVPTKDIKVRLDYHVPGEGVISQESVFKDMEAVNDFIKKVSADGVTFNAKARPESTYYPAHSLHKIVCRPIL